MPLFLLFTFMLAYCVNRLSSLEAHSSQSILAGKKEQNPKGGHITELRQNFQGKILLQNLSQTMSPGCYFALLCSVFIVSLPVSLSLQVCVYRKLCHYSVYKELTTEPWPCLHSS